MLILQFYEKIIVSKKKIIFKDVKEEEPRESPRKGKVPDPEGSKSSSRCLRLNNNALIELGALMEIAKTKFENPSQLAWIDLSFNELSNIHPVSKV